MNESSVRKRRRRMLVPVVVGAAVVAAGVGAVASFSTASAADRPTLSVLNTAPGVDTLSASDASQIRRALSISHEDASGANVAKVIDSPDKDVFLIRTAADKLCLVKIAKSDGVAFSCAPEALLSQGIYLGTRADESSPVEMVVVVPDGYTSADVSVVGSAVARVEVRNNAASFVSKRPEAHLRLTSSKTILDLSVAAGS